MDESVNKMSKFDILGSMNLRTKTLLAIGLSAFILILVVIISFTIDPKSITTNWSMMIQPPSFEHIFGTVWLGRDMFIRTLKGLGLSVQIGFFASVLSSIIAVALAFLSSFNKYLDSFVSWLIDVFLSIPHILLIILISIALGGGAFGVLVGVAFTHWTSLARVLRAEIKRIKTSEFGSQAAGGPSIVLIVITLELLLYERTSAPDAGSAFYFRITSFYNQFRFQRDAKHVLGRCIKDVVNADACAQSYPVVLTDILPESDIGRQNTGITGAAIA